MSDNLRELRSKTPGKLPVVNKQSKTSIKATPKTTLTPKSKSRGRPRSAKTATVNESEDELDKDVNTRVSQETDATGSNKKNYKATEIKLRRRDKIKTTERYSPEAYEPVKRGRKGPIQFPSTASSSSKYISFDSDDEMVYGVTSSPKKKKSDLGTKKEVKVVVDLKKDGNSNKMVLLLPDGTTYKFDSTPEIVPKGRIRKRPLDEDYEEYYDDDGEVEDDTDDEFTPTPSRTPVKRKKATPKVAKLERIIVDDFNNSTTSGSKQIVSSSLKSSKTPNICKTKSVNETTTSPKVIVTPKVMTSSDGTKTTKITQPSSAGKTKVTFITTPKSVTLTAANTSFKQPPKRNYGSAAKFIDELPDLGECTAEDNDANYTKLPDKVLFVMSDLPLKYSIPSTTENNERSLYLFRQVISPVMTTYPCLICPSGRFNFKEEKDLVWHYSTHHELTADTITAKVSDDIVFICLPKAILTQMNEDSNATVLINSPCQYCGEGVRLATVDDMQSHYPSVHAKGIQLIEQEEILNMHKSVYCCLCDQKSSDFTAHHDHMKSEHKLHTLVCKCCPFTTKDASRIKTHYKAKHMISNTKMQNLQCCYCNGLVTGIERMNKHIMSSHCVQTGISEFSCTSCLQPCGKSDELLAHSYKCPNLNSGASKENDEMKSVADIKSGKELTAKCFLCDKVFESEEKCILHLVHLHTKWTVRNVIHDTFLMVKHPNGKTDLMPSNASGTEASPMTLSDLPSVKELEEIGTKTNYGHYCFKCETVIEIYPLYYLHMYNVHKMDKIFECKVSSCKQAFKDPKGLEDHIKATKHPQKSVIEDPLFAIACHYCNVYFADEKEMQEHHLSEDHFHKLNLLIDKSGNKPEPRNHKCKTCHTWFGLADSFVYHMESESHKHGCPYCGLHFALPSSRRTHIQSHHSEKADICELCNVKQGSKERLFAHLVEHSIVFECNRCMRKFYQREQLNAHMETHGESLTCPWEGCAKKIMRSSLSTHIRQHRIENESKCTICGKGFANKQSLSAHMDVHAKAETNAKAILSAVNTSSAEKSVSHPASVTNTNAVGTTLISITTPPTNMTSIKQRTPAMRTKNKTLKSGTSMVQAKNTTTMLSGLRIMCCGCNQLFNSHNELSVHKCVVPVMTITGTKGDGVVGVNDKNELAQAVMGCNLQLLKDETTSDQLEEDPQKLVLDLAAQLTQSVQEEEVEKLKQKQIQKIEHLRQTQTHSAQKQLESQKTYSSIQSRAKKTYSSVKNSQSSNNNNNTPKEKASNNSIEEIKNSTSEVSMANISTTTNTTIITKDERQKEDPTKVIMSYNSVEERLEDEKTKTETVDGLVSGNTGSDEQFVTVRDEKGQEYQICIPPNMTIDELLRSLVLSGNEEMADGTKTIDQEAQISAIATENGNSISIEQTNNGQHLICVPVCEDGSLCLDDATLALLGGGESGEIFITPSN